MVHHFNCRTLKASGIVSERMVKNIQQCYKFLKSDTLEMRFVVCVGPGMYRFGCMTGIGFGSGFNDDVVDIFCDTDECGLTDRSLPTVLARERGADRMAPGSRALVGVVAVGGVFDCGS
jgi:hypothetical protein